MKRYCILAFVTIVAIVACNKEKDVVLPEDASPVSILSEGRVIRVDAVETRSAIAAKPEGGYGFTWQQYDAIRLFEFVYENFGSEESDARDLDWFYSSGLEEDAPSASFSVNLNTTLTAPEGAKYRYVGVYPSEYPDFWGYWTEESAGYNDYSEIWPDSECPFNHPVFYTDFPYKQYPAASSFDPRADLMVSKALVLDDRAENSIALQFARVGAIVKMTLTGLPVGEKLESGYLLFGDSYQVCNKVEYDPELEMVRLVPGEEVMVGKDWWEPEYLFGFVSARAVEFNPTDLYVGQDGKAEIWLRLPAGQVTDSFFVRVWTCSDQNDPDLELVPGERHSFGKSVDLTSTGKTLTFADGRMTTFSVSTQEIVDPYITLSYHYTDDEGVEQVAVSENGSINVGCYGAYLLPAGGSVVLDVETNADPSDIIFEDYSDWADCSFDPATMKLTITYDACTDYANYMVSNRGSYIYMGLSSFEGAKIQMNINQLKPYFSDSGSRKCVLTWHGGTVTGLIKCNAEPVIECPDDQNGTVSWEAVKTGSGYEVTFTVGPNETGQLDVLEAFIRDAVSPASKYVKVNLIRFPMISEGTYYILTQNAYSGTTPYPWFAACASDASTAIYPAQVALDGNGNLDFEHTDDLRAFTFTRIEGSEDYRISCMIGGTRYYLYLGRTRTTNPYTIYADLTPSVPKYDATGKDLSRWDILSLDDRVAILNHAHADMENHTNSYSLHFNLGSTTTLYLAQPAYAQITYNKGSYGTSYFCKTYSYFLQPATPYSLKLFDMVEETYLPE